MYTCKVVITLAMDVDNETTATQAAIGCKDMLLEGMQKIGGPDLSSITTIVNADAHMQPAPAQPSDVPEIGQLQADAIDALSKYLSALERECQGTDEEVEPQFIDSAYILDCIEAESDMISLIAYAVKNELQFPETMEH